MIISILMELFKCVMKFCVTFWSPPSVTYFDPDRIRVDNYVRLRCGLKAKITGFYLEGRKRVFLGGFVYDPDLPLYVNETLLKTRLKWSEDGSHFNSTRHKFVGELYLPSNHEYDIVSMIL